MNDTSANPVFVALLFLLRCLVPLVILFGISYLLRRMGLVAETPQPPKEEIEEIGDEKRELKVSPRKKNRPKKITPPKKKKIRRSSRK